ncbi:MAG TPA: hypothetical protein VFH56_11040 [Acidimicrobiales bacterium]|nr:hypothetical protein [Acidimicrobiales bacterium]
MTWLTVWDTPTWPHHDYAEHATEAEAEAAARKMLGVEVAVVPVRDEVQDEYAEASK